MKKDLDDFAFLLEQSENKMALLDKKLAFLNKLLVVIGIVMLLFCIYK